MAADAEELRARIDEQRSEITGTVEQIENRIMPGRIMARRRDRVRNTLTDWKDAVFGNDEPEYPEPWYQYGTGTAWQSGSGARSGHADQRGQQGLLPRAGEAASSMAHTVVDTIEDVPTMARRRTRGNPMAAGAVALGVGWIVGGLAPRTRREQAMVRRVEPALATVAAAATTEAQQVVGDLREPAQEALHEVQHAGRDAVDELRDETRQAAGEVRDGATG